MLAWLVYDVLFRLLKGRELLLGAAILAGVGVGTWPSVDDACEQFIASSVAASPDPNAAAVLNANYSAYRRIYPALRSLAVPEPL